MPSSDPLDTMIETFSMLPSMAELLSLAARRGRAAVVLCRVIPGGPGRPVVPRRAPGGAARAGDAAPGHPPGGPAPPGGSDAAPGLGDAGHLGGDLGRALREQLVQLLDADPGGLAQDPDRRPGALLLVLVPHELDDLPVPVGQLIDALGHGDLRRHLLGPLTRVGEEPVVTDGHGLPGVSDVRHWCLLISCQLARLPPAAVLVRARVAARPRLPRSGIAEPMPGMSRPGSSPCQ